jgi:hypothetical protein
MPEILCGVAVVNDSLSPQRPRTTKRRITYNMWAADEEWIKFRTTPHSGHVPSHIPTLVRDDFLPCSADKRKREEIKENVDFNGEEKT